MENETDQPVYILLPLEEETLPPEFPGLTDYIEIQNALINNWDFQRIVPEEIPEE